MNPITSLQIRLVTDADRDICLELKSPVKLNICQILVPIEGEDDAFNVQLSGASVNTGIQLFGTSVKELKEGLSRQLISLYEDAVDDVISGKTPDKLSQPKKFLFDNGIMYSVESYNEKHLELEEKELKKNGNQ